MKILDLTESYINLVLNKKEYETYTNLYPQLFEHYFNFWSKKEIEKSYDINLIRSSTELVKNTLEVLVPLFEKQNLSIHNLQIILFVGNGNTNGHAFSNNEVFVVWIPVETYSDELNCRVFLTHEIIHALHYENSSSFYFSDKSEQVEIARLIITEGIATYITREILHIDSMTAFWGSYIEKSYQKKWIADCNKEIEKLKRITKEHFYVNSHNLEYFFANDETDILKYRAGYFLGLMLIEEYVKQNKLSFIELLRIPSQRFKNEIFNLL